jgi:hypothetical protein
VSKPTPEWLVVGAEVLVYTDGSHGTPMHPSRGVVTRIHPKSFRIDCEDELYDLDNQQRRDTASSWRVSTRRAVPRDSAEARKALWRNTRENLISQVDAAHREWGRTRAAEELGELAEWIDRLQCHENNPPKN